MTRTHARIRLLDIILLSLGLAATPVVAQEVRPGIWGTDGSVYASARLGNTLYIGGTFGRVGPNTGPCAAVSAASGAWIPGFPVVDGSRQFPFTYGVVNAITSDGAGGWYIGGRFDWVGDLPRKNAAHVLADRTVSSWSPNPDGEVFAIAVGGAAVYLGGSFTNVGGVARANIAAVHPVTGVLTSWNPGTDGSVRALAVGTSTVFVGGTFTSVAGEQRRGLAQIWISDGTAFGWSPSLGLGNQVHCILIDGETIYVGGKFTVMNAMARVSAVAFQSNGGVKAWDPTVTVTGGGPGTVVALAKSGDTVYLGGSFEFIGGQARMRIGAVDATTGAPTSFDAALGAPPFFAPTVNAIAAAGDLVHVGGDFQSTHGTARSHLATVDAAGQPVPGWRADASSPVQALGIGGNELVVGGSFALLGCEPRSNLAAIDLSTGSATSWNPSANGSVRAMAAGAGRVHVGGFFTNAGGQARPYLVELDAVSGLATGWTPSPNAAVLELARDGSRLYVGGGFLSLSGTTRRGLGAYDTNTGALLSWNPDVGGVSALVVHGSSVFVGGGSMLVRVDAATGDTTMLPELSTDFGVTLVLSSLAAYGGTLYVGGRFTRVGGLARSSLAAVDIATGEVTAWDLGPVRNHCPGDLCDIEVMALAVAGGYVYAGGIFDSIAGVPRKHLAALDPVSGAAVGGDLQPTSYAYSLLAGPDDVVVGGVFNTLLNARAKGLAVVSLPPPLAAPPPRRASGLELAPVSPNPVGREAATTFWLPRVSSARARLMDVAGRVVHTLLDEEALEAGPHALRFGRGGLSPGVYFLELTTNDERLSRIVVVR